MSPQLVALGWCGCGLLHPLLVAGLEQSAHALPQDGPPPRPPPPASAGEAPQTCRRRHPCARSWAAGGAPPPGWPAPQGPPPELRPGRLHPAGRRLRRLQPVQSRPPSGAAARSHHPAGPLPRRGRPQHVVLKRELVVAWQQARQRAQLVQQQRAHPPPVWLQLRQPAPVVTHRALSQPALQVSCTAYLDNSCNWIQLQSAARRYPEHNARWDDEVPAPHSTEDLCACFEGQHSGT